MSSFSIWHWMVVLCALLMLIGCGVWYRYRLRRIQRYQQQQPEVVDTKVCGECGGVIKARAAVCILCGCAQPKNQWISDQPHPWRRYFARTLDYLVNGFVVFFLIAVAFYIWRPDEADHFFTTLGNDETKVLDGLIMVTCAIPLNALLVGLTGGTLGKWLFGIRMQRDKKPIGVGPAFYREIMVWVKGMAFGIPLICLGTSIASYQRLKLTGRTSWDKTTEVTYRPQGLRQMMGATFGVITMVLVFGGINALGSSQVAAGSSQAMNLPKATVKLVNDRTIRIDGSFGLGTATEFRRVLESSPDAKFVALESNIGGFVDEGLAIYDLIRARHLSTVTYTECVSACTIAYMAGARRFLGDAAVLRFHQWEINGTRVDRNSNMARRLLVTAGISDEFADKAFAGHALWTPDRVTLIAAGVVTHSMEGKSTDDQHSP